MTRTLRHARVLKSLAAFLGFLGGTMAVAPITATTAAAQLAPSANSCLTLQIITPSQLVPELSDQATISGVTAAIKRVLAAELPRARVLTADDVKADLLRRQQAMEKFRTEHPGDDKALAEASEIIMRGFTGGLSESIVTWSAHALGARYVLTLSVTPGDAGEVSVNVTGPRSELAQVYADRYQALARTLATKIASEYGCVRLTEHLVKISGDVFSWKHRFDAEARDLKDRPMDGRVVQFVLNPLASVSPLDATVSGGVATATVGPVSKGKSYVLAASLGRKGLRPSVDSARLSAPDDSVQIAFKGTLDNREGGFGTGTIAVQFSSVAKGLATLSGDGDNRAGEADVLVSGTVTIAAVILGAINCNGSRSFTGAVHVVWGVEDGKATPVSWDFKDRSVLPTICPWNGKDLLNPEDYFPAIFGEPDDDTGTPPIPLEGANPDARAVLDDTPFAVHYKGVQSFKGSDSGGQFVGTRTYDLTVKLTQPTGRN